MSDPEALTYEVLLPCRWHLLAHSDPVQTSGLGIAIPFKVALEQPELPEVQLFVSTALLSMCSRLPSALTLGLGRWLPPPCLL